MKTIGKAIEVLLRYNPCIMSRWVLHGAAGMQISDQFFRDKSAMFKNKSIAVVVTAFNEEKLIVKVLESMPQEP